jgi:hypothetical protein
MACNKVGIGFWKIAPQLALLTINRRTEKGCVGLYVLIKERTLSTFIISRKAAKIRSWQRRWGGERAFAERGQCP